MRQALDARGLAYDTLDSGTPEGLALMAYHGRMSVPLLVDDGAVVVDHTAWLAERKGE